MQFDSLAALWHMNGHGAYVWSVYAVVVVALCALVAAPLLERRRLLREVAARARRDAARGRAAGDGGEG